MPVVGHFAGGVDFADLKCNYLIRSIRSRRFLTADVATPENAIRYGVHGSIQLLTLLIVGFVMFLMVKAYNKTKAPEPEEPAPAGPTAEELLAEIRDALRK